MNFYISDLHFGCTNKFENRTIEYDDLIVNNWNKKVTNADTVYILGDIGKFGKNEDNEYAVSKLAKLKGNKCLIIGNHDSKGIKDKRVSQLFIEICNYKEIVDNFDGKSYKLVLSHYPIFSWNGCYKDTTLLYGHTHGNFDDKLFQESIMNLRREANIINKLNDNTTNKIKNEPFAYNVGAMLPYMNYTPRTLKEIIKQ